MTARDVLGQVAGGYRDTARLSAIYMDAGPPAPDGSRTDTYAATFPGSPYTFTADDSGVHTFRDVLFPTAGKVRVRARDTSGAWPRGVRLVNVQSE